MTTEKQKQQPEQQVDIQRIYVKNLSFESPSTPDVFTKQCQPEIKVDLDISNVAMGNHLFEVVLSVTASAVEKDNVLFLAEVEQAAIFHAQGFNEQQLEHVLSVFCPTVLFPYAREVISDVVTRGNFPPLILAPTNFEAMYQQQKQAKAEQKNATTETKH